MQKQLRLRIKALLMQLLLTLYHQRQMRNHRCSVSNAFVLCTAAVAVVLGGCRSLPPSKPSSQWTPQEARGAAVYQVHCARCHRPNDTHPLNGPGLQAITKVSALPSGAPPTDERLTAVIERGRGMMPGTYLNEEQMQDLLAYLKTL